MAKIESEYSKLVSMLKAYEKILHPDVFNPMLSQLQKSFEENKKEDFANAKISDEALQIERIMIDTRESIKNVSGNGSYQTLRTFLYKIAYKKFLKLFDIEKK